MMIYLAERGEVPPPGVIRIPRLDENGVAETNDRDEQVYDEHTTMEPAAKGGWRSKRIMLAVFDGQVKVDCDLDVTSEDGAAFVDRYGYIMTFTEPNGGQEILRFNVSPD
jgi:hypothetical protein